MKQGLRSVSRRSRLAAKTVDVINRVHSQPTRSLSSVAALGGDSGAYADEMFKQWKQNPSSVHPSWDSYFKELQTPAPAPLVAAAPSQQQQPNALNESSDVSRLLHFIHAYQASGHKAASLDPLGLTPRPPVPELDYRSYGWTEHDLNRTLNLTGYGVEGIAGLMSGADLNKDGATTLAEVIQTLKTIYCRSVGFEFAHLGEIAQSNWIRSKIEIPDAHLKVTKEERLQLLDRLAFAEKFEAFCATKYNTAKRFGLEGCESLVPGLKAGIDRSTELGVEHIVFGMPHRGRLNVLANVIRKPMEMIFKEFAGTNKPDGNDWSGSGDVKYHLGTSFDRVYPDGRRVHLSLVANPSHLEAVNPVVLGKARAKMHYIDDTKGHKVMAVLIHGDAANAGQGIVYESMQLVGLEHYQTGGTLHIVCNNQVGFTTDPADSRSTPYSSDIGKAFNAPVFHVNADDPEEVCRVFRLAIEWRQTFHTDVVIDLIGYRRHGHNELDQPSFTQPAMYKKIGSHPTVLKQYTKFLLDKNVLTEEEVKSVLVRVDEIIAGRFEASKTHPSKIAWLDSAWGGLKAPSQKPSPTVQTACSPEIIEDVSKALVTMPDKFTLHRQIQRIFDEKKQKLADGKDFDWSIGEALAFGTLLREGIHVRLSGQDAQRGTFSHRHAVVHDQENASIYTPLAHIKGATAKCVFANSPLSEYGVLGFELGYSLENPHALVIWEAQFGDFVNGAQIIIDQFLAAGEAKWLRQSGLVMLLPHGYDGQGPEHSSCRVERFLQSSDEDPDFVPPSFDESQVQQCNWQIVNCTTPANYFHLLRRQVKREFRKPLIVMSPKNMLRLRQCASKLKEFTEGSFQRVIPEQSTALVSPDKIRRVVMCCGKLYYELAAAREAGKINDVAIVRIEQLSPFPFDLVAAEMAKCPNAEVVWAQEEPKNMGAWNFVQDRIMTATRVLNKRELRPAYVGRNTMSSPAEGYGKVHDKEQKKLIEIALSTKVSAYGHGRASKDEN